MNIRQHLINVTIKPVWDVVNNNVINMVKNYVSPRMYKQAQTSVVLEQKIADVLPIYKDAIDYIICEIRSTIQHEGQHRADEMDWQQSDPEQRMSFDTLVSPSRAESGPERAEENCLAPEIVSGQVEQISAYELFERAKVQANIDPTWKNDIVAATLPQGTAGQYLMKSLTPDDMLQANQLDPDVYRYGNTLLIDIRKHIEPWIASEKSFPANVQTSGDGAIEQDPDMYRPAQEGTAHDLVPPVPPVPVI